MPEAARTLGRAMGKSVDSVQGFPPRRCDQDAEAASAAVA